MKSFDARDSLEDSNQLANAGGGVSAEVLCRQYQVGDYGGDIAIRRSSRHVNATARSSALATLTEGYGAALRHASSISRCSRWRVAAARRSPRRRINNPHRTSNQRLSKITRRTQIVGSGRVPPGRNGLRWRDLCFEARDWAAFEARGSSGEGSSGSAVTDAAHNTNFTRRGLRPLATAGEVVGLGERRWKPLRRPCGRLPGLRKTLNVGGNGRERQTDVLSTAAAALRRPERKVSVSPGRRG
jgi:hypothetical protein